MTFKLQNFLGRVTPGWQNLNDQDRSAIARQGLLASGLALLSARNGGNFGASLADGLKSGLLAVNEGVIDTENARYKNDILARTRQGMERNAAIEQAQKGVLNPDGSLNEDSWSQWASVDPVGAQEFRQKASPRAKWEPTQIGYRDPKTGRDGLLDVWVNKDTREVRDLQNNPISSGLLAPDAVQPQMPKAGLLGADVLPGLEQAVMQVESGGNPAAVSSKGAMGTMQTMPGTLRDPGYGVTAARDQSPAEMERVGKDYLQAMLRQYGDPRLALAAYNWGPGNVDRAMQAHGGNVDAVLANAPAETRAYVPKVLQRSGTQTAAAPQIGFRPTKEPNQTERQAPSGYRYTADGGSLAPIPGGPADRKNNPAPGDLAQAEQALRKEYSSQIKTPQTVVNSYRQIEQAATNPSAQNDLALIFSYMRMLDPASVVREGEFATAQNAAGVPDQIRNAYNKAINGERLNPEQRTGFVSSARGLRDQAQQQIDAYREQYSGLAKEYNYSPERIVGRGSSSRKEGQVPPAAVDFLRKNPNMRAAFEQKYGVSADDYLR
ncbi:MULTISPECIES: lytic transglycosylase domain-containing protein [Stenotrophomonas]|uniref:lytic transglycosylase domain-containing protein n=1 Tax=Stenotrophomonas TaxID=40323 RepID=UPI000B648133|nr:MULTISPECIES: lytic transglycosylase domain-containing protein [Stenotrophomonas]SMR76410.1 Transglycosylase SLT domain-containing protein [Stenotrophomonas sp. yr243]SNS68492.1 Transglycosylase SLT domain-containing protein [Stenotrophomonas lactitubi]